MDEIKKILGTHFNYLLILIFVLSFIVRFWDLGYSNFYGDETKTFYLDKTVPATQFFIDQRKGPVQFFVVWGVEKVVGGHDEFWTRVPFALAGFLSCIAFYLLVKKIFGRYIALASVIMFSFNGFNIAFSRTIQYQSFLMLFGLTGLFLGVLYYYGKYLRYLYFSAILFGLAFLTHYDSLFFLFPLLLFIFSDIKGNVTRVRTYLIYFLFPLFLLITAFYLPYYLSGYFDVNTVNYVRERLVGSGYTVNYSLYTVNVYNPGYIYLSFLLLGFSLIFINKTLKVDVFMFWFIIPFLLLEIVILNPGTHINNFVIPLSVMSVLTLFYLYEKLEPNWIKKSLLVISGFFLLLMMVINFFVYLPTFNKLYPWADMDLVIADLKRVDKNYHLFLYGFPYNRGWDQISDYFKGLSGVRGVYTNDNDTIAQYYLKGIDYTPPGSNFLPQYYIDVKNNQEVNVQKHDLSILLGVKYEKIKEIFFDGSLTAEIYIRNY
jgi:4-amino-4-deoxy-L-arabinose transferase-like glycosyltransferase